MNKYLIIIFIISIFYTNAFVYQYEGVRDPINNISVYKSSDHPQWSLEKKYPHKSFQNLQKMFTPEPVFPPYMVKPLEFKFKNHNFEIIFFGKHERYIYIQTDTNIYKFSETESVVHIDISEICLESNKINVVIHDKHNHERINHLNCPAKVLDSKLYIKVTHFIANIFNSPVVQSFLAISSTIHFYKFLKKTIIDYKKYQIKKLKEYYKMKRANKLKENLDVDHDHDHEVFKEKSSRIVENYQSVCQAINELSFKKTFILILVLLFMVDLSRACDSYIVDGNGFILSTTIDGDKKVTNVKGFFSLTIPSTSSTVCITLNSEGSNLGTFKLELEHFLYTSSEHLYVTSLHTPVVASKHQFFGNGGCGKGKCGGLDINSKDAEGELPERDFEASRYVGESFCDSPYTNIQLKHYLKPSDKACIYSKIGHKQIGDSIPVFKITSTRVKVNFTVHADGSPLSVGLNDDSKDVNIKFAHSEIPNDSSLNNKNSIFYQNKWHLGHACERSIPVVGMVGDFQADNKQDLLNNKVVVAPNMHYNKRHTRDGSHTTTAFDSHNSSAYLISTFPHSPVINGDNIWTADADGTWYTFPKTHEPIKVSLEITGRKNITFYRTIHKPEPFVKSFGNLVSCKSCLNESSIYVEMKSSTIPGHTEVTCNSKGIFIITKVLDLTTEIKNYTIRYSTALTFIDHEFCFDGKACIRVRNTLDFAHFKLLSLGSKTVSNGTDPDEPDTGFDFDLVHLIKNAVKKWFNFLLDFWSSAFGINIKKWLIIGIIVLIGCVIGFFFVRRFFFSLIKKVI